MAQKVSDPYQADTFKMAVRAMMTLSTFLFYSENLVKTTAKAMVKSGFQAAGYKYVILDDCWQAKSRDKDGHLQADPKRFPAGMKALADYVRKYFL